MLTKYRKTGVLKTKLKQISMKIETTSENLAKHNALTAAFFVQQFVGKELTVEMLKAIKKATQNDIENGSIERSIIDFDKYTEI